MKIFFLFAALCVAVSSAAPRDLHFFASEPEIPFQQAWDIFKSQHGKAYASEQEERLRRNLFADNLRKIESHNYLFEMGLKSYKMGINQFSDMAPAEIRNFTGLRQIEKTKNDHATYLSLNNVVLPKSVDWRDKGYVTPVKSQGGCGSCWAFSATGSLEGQHFRKTGQLVSLSEQNLVDCAGDQGNEGCKGGLMDKAFQYIKDNGGIDTEDSYPYEAVDGTCRYKKKNMGATVTGFVDVESGSESLLMEAVATVGPVSVAINALDSFFQYKGGVYEADDCDPEKLNHGVLAVGYGTLDGKDYWLIKNSWGQRWGINGYVLMARNKKNMCGVASLASYPLV